MPWRRYPQQPRPSANESKNGWSLTHRQPARSQAARMFWQRYPRRPRPSANESKNDWSLTHRRPARWQAAQML
ncbi:hypothetical protein BVIET440_40132 [Burkholderia vietnamiensis]